MDIRVLLGGTVPGSLPAGPARTSRSGAATAGTGPSPTNPQPFDGVLRQFLKAPAQGLKISAHAEKRLQERNISMTTELRSTLEQALDELQAKGSRDSLVLCGGDAFVVNVPSRTLITAMRREDLQNRIITHIDSVNMTTPS